MEFKEKILQYWLTFILTFLGFSKTLIIIPVFLQLEISNYYLISFITLIFWPADYLARVFESFAEVNGMLMFAAVILAIARLILFTIESYVLVFILLKISFNKSFQTRSKELIGKKIVELKEKSLKANIHNSEQNIKNIKNIKNYLPLVVGFALIFSVVMGAYYVLKNYRSQEEIKISASAEEKMRDTQRMENIVKIKEALDNYAKENKGFYPKTEGAEKISDAVSSSFLALQNGNYISKLYVDPLPDKYFYGYFSDGKSYELTTVLEKQKDKCVQEGDVCVYRLSGTYVFTEEEIESGVLLDRCEFPKIAEDYVLEFIKTENMKNSSDDFLIKYQRSNVTSVQYSGFFIWGYITVVEFFDKGDADSAFEEQLNHASGRVSECEISGTKGFCAKAAYGGKLKEQDPKISFAWKDRNTVRSLNFNIKAEKANQIASFAEKEKIVKKAAEMFLAMAKDCNIDLEENYAAPYLKRMSF